MTYDLLNIVDPKSVSAHICETSTLLTWNSSQLMTLNRPPKKEKSSKTGPTMHTS
jgi:hypothetical protein